MCTWPSYVAQPYAFGFSYRHFISAKVILMLTLHFPPFMPHRVSPRRSYISLAITRTYFLLAFRAYFDWRTLQLCFGHTMKRSLLHLATTFVAATAAVAAAGKANFNEANKFSLMSTANRFANIKELLHLKAL